MTTTYEMVASAGVPDEYRVEGIDHDREGVVYVAIFSGPEAEQRAREYARLKNSALGQFRYTAGGAGGRT